MFEATTQGIRVAVKTRFLSEQSNPHAARFVFAYTITIENHSEQTAQLSHRHWIISDGSGQVEEVRGEGVVGETPRLRPGESFQYSSGCVLKTPWGTMRGYYTMHPEGAETFEAEIPEFLLAIPKLHTLSDTN